LGFPDQSLEKVKSSIALAHDQEHYPSLSWGLGFYAAVHFDRGEFELARKIAKRSVALSHEHDFPLWEAWGHVLYGSASIALDQKDDGLKEIEEGIYKYNSTGAGVASPYFYSLEALSLLKLKKPNAALMSINKALLLTDRQSINSIKSELLRLKAVALWDAEVGSRQEVLELLTQSIKVARQQRAKSLELRTLLTQAEALGAVNGDLILQLTELYQWFSEGFDTLDLKKVINWIN